jgi:hypothetical protein
MATLNVPNSIANGDALDATPVQANFDAIETHINDSLVHRDGSRAMSAALTLAGAPSSTNHAATKGYVDTAVAGAVAGVMPDNSVTTAKLANGAVTAEKIAAGVLNITVADASITQAKLAADSVTNAKIADGVVTGVKIADGTINIEKLLAGPRCVLERSNTTTVGAGATTAINWVTTIADDDAMHSGTSAVVTAVKAGVYSVQFKLRGLDAQGIVIVDAGGQTWRVPTERGILAYTFNFVFGLAQNDTVQVSYFNGKGTAQDVLEGRFEMRWLHR